MSDSPGDHEPGALAQTQGALDAETVRQTGERMPGMREAFVEGTLVDPAYEDQAQGDEHRDAPPGAPTGVPEPVDRLQVTHRVPATGTSAADAGGDPEPEPDRDVPGL